MKWKIVFVLSLLSHQQKVDCLWYETFQTCLRGDAYSTQFQVRVWKSWVENKSLMIRCVNSAEYLKKHGQELTAKVFSSLDVSEKEEIIVTIQMYEGFTIIDKNLGEIGTIESVVEFPQQDMAFVTYKEKEVMIPLNDSIVTQIDEDKKELIVDLPEGLLEL